MDGAGDIVAVSIPFAAGILAGGLLTQAALAPFACPVAAAGAVAVFASSRKCNIGLSILTFFALGVFCRVSDGILPSPAPAFRLPGAEPLKTLINALPFSCGDTAPLLTALLTGDRSGLSHELTASFRGAGASHILALSGLHLGVIYGIIRKTTAPMGNTRPAKILRCCITILLCGAYAAMTGATPSIVRAFLFISIEELLRLSPGRSRSRISILCTAMTVQLAVSPGVIDTLAFQLSYLAMLGIFTLFPLLEGWYPGNGSFDPMRKVWNSAALSISCQTFTAPLVWIRFHTFPKYFLLTNILALPLSELLIVCGLVSIALVAAGLPCVAFIKTTDFLARALCECLRIISEM